LIGDQYPSKFGISLSSQRKGCDWGAFWKKHFLLDAHAGSGAIDLQKRRFLAI
jgi:hypothetical protein